MTPSTSPTRRLVLAAAGASLLPRAARAQPAKRRRIAFLSGGSPSSGAPNLEALRQGLRALGYGDENLEIEIRYADGHPGRLPDLAVELVHLAPEVIVAVGPAAVQAAKQATSTIPIVMVSFADPVGAGFVASLAHPGGNVTGLANLAQETMGKRLQLLKTAIPGSERIAILLNPGNPGNILQLQAARQPARTLRTELLSVEAGSLDDIDSAFGTMTRERADALIVLSDPISIEAKSRIVELAASHKLPAIYPIREFAVVGGLMSYGTDLNDLNRSAATFVDKILKGAKPADLPVEQPTKFSLVVNLKTAQALGLTIPPAILAGADEVIE
jgi:putative tryptophan/tyrosine transport system substrate-binding protein